MQHYPTLQHISILFPGMADVVPKFLNSFDSQPRQHRNHAFSAQFRTEIMVIVIARLYPHRIREASNAAPGGDGRLAFALGFGKKLGDWDLQALADLK